MKNDTNNIVSYYRKFFQENKTLSQESNSVVSGFRVRAGIHIGAWWCNSCEGKTEGSKIIQPNCGFCQVS